MSAITPDDVLAVLGVADAEQLFAAVDAIVARDPAAALRAAAALASSGRDPGQVLRDLEVHARELLTVQVLGEFPAELRVTAERDQRLAQQAQTLARDRCRAPARAGLGSARGDRQRRPAPDSVGAGPDQGRRAGDGPVDFGATGSH